jgi:hypothetical protein
MSKPAKQAAEIRRMASVARFTGLRQYSSFIPSTEALGYMPSPAFAGFHAISG